MTGSVHAKILLIKRQTQYACHYNSLLNINHTEWRTFYVFFATMAIFIGIITYVIIGPSLVKNPNFYVLS